MPPSVQRVEITEEAVVTMKDRRSCVHFDKYVNLDKLLEKIKSSQQIKCGECKEGVHVKRGSKGKVLIRKNRFSSSSDPKSVEKAIWVCLECGYYACGDVGLPTGPRNHVMRHIWSTRHCLVIQCENPQLRWCFSCESLLLFEKEEHGEKKDLLLDVVKLIKERSSNTLSTTVETDISCSGSGSITVGIEESDGYAVRGLLNLGNTCFFNSVMQNLLSLDQLREHFLKEDTFVGGPLVSSLKRLFAETKSKPGFFKSAMNPIAFFGSVCSQAPQFRGYQQHDSHELLRCLLDGLSIEESSLRQTLDVSDSDDSSTHQKPTLIDSVFGGELSSTVSCLECGHSSKVYEPFLDLSLPVPSKKPPPKKQQTCSQVKKVLENGTVSKDSEVVSAKPELDHNSIVSILETPSTMALDDKQASELATESDSKFESFWSGIMRVETSKKETDLVLQGNVSDTAPSTQAKEVDQALVGSRETLMPDNGGSAKQETVPYKEDARTMQSNEDTATSGISAEIDEAQVCGCPGLGQSSSSANMWANEELPVMVTDSQVLYMPYKDDISYDNNTVAAGKGEASLSHVSGHHEQTEDQVDSNPFLDDPGILCNDKTVKAGESEASLSLVSDDHEQNIDYVDFSSFFDEPEIPEGPAFRLHSKVEASEACFMTVSSNDKIIRAGEDEASSSFVSGGHERNKDYINWGRFFYEPEIFERPVFGLPFKAGYMAVSSDSDPEVLDDSDSPVSVDRCLAQFTKPEILSEDNAWHCENCSKNLKLQLLREKTKTREGLGNGWVNEIEASSASDECRDNSLNQSRIALENGYKAAPLTELLNCKDEKNAIDDGIQGDSDTKQAPFTSSATETPILGGETISPQPANGKECENSEDEAVDSEKVIVKRAATKRVLVNKAPPVLTIHLKRFSQDARGRLSKLSGHVDFQEFIYLSQYMDTRWTEEDQPVYRLAGLVEHKGTMRGGHYVAYIRGGHKKKTNSDIKDPNSSIWYHASDSFVRRASFEEVLRSEAYILFYERI